MLPREGGPENTSTSFGTIVYGGTWGVWSKGKENLLRRMRAMHILKKGSVNSEKLIPSGSGEKGLTGFEGQGPLSPVHGTVNV